LDVAAIIIVSGVAVGSVLLLFISILFKSAHSMIAEVSSVAAGGERGSTEVVEEAAVKSTEATEVREAAVSQAPQVQESRAEAKEVSQKISSVDAKILELRKKGLSIKKIAKEVGLSPSTVYRRLKKLTSGKK